MERLLYLFGEKREKSKRGKGGNAEFGTSVEGKISSTRNGKNQLILQPRALGPHANQRPRDRGSVKKKPGRGDKIGRELDKHRLGSKGGVQYCRKL